MSGYLNRAQLIGNLGQDPEVRTMQAGKKIVTLNLATSESWRDGHTGERVERVEWHRVVIFNEGLATLAEKFLAKGAKILVEGKLATRKWTDNAGVDRYATEIQVQPYTGSLTFLDSKKRGDERASGRGGDGAERGPAMAGGGASWKPTDTALDDDVPF